MPESLQAQVDAVLDEIGLDTLPYLQALDDGRLSKAGFIASQLDFHAAVVAFHRPMAALAARIDDDALRAPILRNVAEELGEGDETRAHGATFMTFLMRLTGESHEVIARRLQGASATTSARTFNAAVTRACVDDDVVVGAATMGIIERMFSTISGRIGRACVARGFLAATDMIHYDLHERLDVRHAEDFLRIVAACWHDPGASTRSDAGLRHGARAFAAFYDDLLRVHRHHG